MDERPHVHVFAEEAAGFPFQSGLMDFILYHIVIIYFQDETILCRACCFAITHHNTKECGEELASHVVTLVGYFQPFVQWDGYRLIQRMAMMISILLGWKHLPSFYD